jgi:hypothetical protein
MKDDKKEVRDALLQAERIAVRGIRDRIKDIHKITTDAIKDKVQATEETTQVK